jgi:hypothetical protein
MFLRPVHNEVVHNKCYSLSKKGRAMEQKEYNGELKTLYHDLDKRMTLSDSKQETLWKVHDDGAKVRETYIHTRFHDVIDDIATVKLALETIKTMINKLPCDKRDERHDGVKTQLKAIWWIIGSTFLGVVATIGKVFSQRNGG